MYGLCMASKEFLKEFMKRRFPHDKEGDSHWEEWEQRLMSGDPRGHMDSQTLKVFNKLKKMSGF